jgi:hypothetical protein
LRVRAAPVALLLSETKKKGTLERPLRGSTARAVGETKTRTAAIEPAGRMAHDGRRWAHSQSCPNQQVRLVSPPKPT